MPTTDKMTMRSRAGVRLHRYHHHRHHHRPQQRRSGLPMSQNFFMQGCRQREQVRVAPSEHQSHHNRRGVRRHLPLRGTRKHQPVRDTCRLRPLRGTRRHQPVRDIRRRQPMRNLFSADLHRSTPKGADARSIWFVSMDVRSVKKVAAEYISCEHTVPTAAWVQYP